MADNVTANPGAGGATFASDDIGGVQYPRHKLVFGDDGVNAGDVSGSNPFPVGIVGAVTIGNAVSLSGVSPVSGPLTDAELRATAVPVSGTVAATNADLTTLAGGTKPEGGTYVTGDRGYVAMAVRQDAMSSLSADGEYTPLQIGSTGRLKVSAEPAAQESTTGNITGNAQTVQISTARTSNLMIYCTGTFSTVNCTFEGSLNGTNWFAVQAIRSNANTIELTTGNLSAAPAYAWEVSVNGMNFFRVRSTAYTSGTQVWQFQPAPYATEPIPASQVGGTQAVSLTSTRIAPNAADGHSTTHHLVSAGTTNATSVKTSAGSIGQIVVTNTNAANRFFKLYNLASAPTVGTSTPVMTVLVPPNQTVQISGSFPAMRCSTGIAYALTTGVAVADTGAVGAADMSVSIFYT